jgi:single-strand DNA-binding protein
LTKDTEKRIILYMANTNDLPVNSKFNRQRKGNKMSINAFTINGNLTKDVELRHLPNGKAVAKFVVAVNNIWYSDNGQKNEECDFIPVTTYGKQAENDAKFLKKGIGVIVTGRIRSWYQAESSKGGFNFEAKEVVYLGKPSNSNAASNSVDADGAGKNTGDEAEMDWVGQYDNYENQSNGH